VTAIHPGPGFLYLCDAGSGAETGLWRSDGSPAGTYFLAPLHCFDPYFDHDPHAALLPNGDLLVSAAGPLGGEELWRSDGTPSGTTMIADLRPGDIGSQPVHFARLGDEVVFTAGTGAGEASLFRSDGTTPGTTAVPLPPGASPYPSFGHWAGDGARYYFGGKDAAHGLEPWVFDGLTAQLLADVVPGPTSSLDEEVFNRSFFAALGGVLVFSADDGVNGEEIWRSDGTGPGTYRLSDLGAGPDPMAIVMWDGWHRPSVIDDELYFFEEQSPGGYRLSRTDGTTIGPTVVRSIDNQSSAFVPVARDRGSLLEYNLGRYCFAAAGSRLFFELSRAPSYGADLWTTDGSLASTAVAVAGLDSGYGLFTPCAGTGDRLLFFDTQQNQQALRALTPDAAAPEELLAGYGGSTMPPFLPSGSGLVFAMTDGLYRSDGTGGGTSMIAATAYATWLAPWGDQVLFGAEGLFATQAASIVPLELTPPASVIAVSEIVALGSRIVFVAESNTAGSELWVSHGIPGDATLLADLVPGSTGALVRVGGLDGMMDVRAPQLVALEDVALFVALTPALGRELWVTDGTAPGTGLLRDIYPGDYPSTPRNLTRVGNRIVFSAEDEAHGLELWVTDGTYPGTTLLKDVAPGLASSVPDDFVVRDGVLYFSAWSPSYGREAWKSDGTTAGTVRISDVAPGPLSSSPQRFARAGNRLYFSATDQIHGYELWAISDDGSVPLFLDGFEVGDTARWSDTIP
jgi:ELWxxDGT repeat protein